MGVETGSRRFILFLICSSMVVTLAETMAAALLIEFSLISRLIITLFLSALMAAIFHFPLILLGIAGLVMAGAWVTHQFFNHLVLSVYEAVGHFVINLLEHAQGREIIFSENAVILWILLTGAAAFFTVVVLFRQQRTWPVLVVYGSCFLLYWYSHVDLAYPMLALFLIGYFILFSLKNLDRRRENWTKESWEVKAHLEKPWLKTASVYALIIVFLSVLLPKQAPWVEWRWMENRILNQFPAVVDLRGDFVYSRSFGRGDYFDFRVTGFQEGASKLGGPVMLNDRLIMRVVADQPLYLRGNVKTLYRENAWHRSPAGTVTLSSQESFPQEVRDGDIIRLTVTNVNFSSMTIFTPYQPLQVESSRYDEVRVDDHYQLSFPDAVYKNESYSVAALIPGEHQQAGSAHDLPADTLQLPETVTDRVRELTHRITAGLTDPYDKALAIQQYLRSHYPYSLTVPHTPEGRDFVDYFLFDLGEGYCTYFATALNVMLRLEGIPSRYVEGYIMPRTETEGTYEIRQRHAHTWTEAFIESRGWITLEATPAYTLPEMLTNGATWREDAGSPFDDYDEFLLLYESAAQAVSQDLETSQTEQVRPATDGDADVMEAPWFQQKGPRGILLLLTAGLMLLGVRSGHQALRYINHQKGLQSLSRNQQAVVLYRNILELLEILGYPIEPGETSYEYARRISKELYDMESLFESLTKHYVLAQYSQNCLAGEAVDQMKFYQEYIDQRIRHKLGIRTYVWRKYLRSDYLTLVHADEQP